MKKINQLDNLGASLRRLSAEVGEIDMPTDAQFEALRAHHVHDDGLSDGEFDMMVSGFKNHLARRVDTLKHMRQLLIDASDAITRLVDYSRVNNTNLDNDNRLDLSTIRFTLQCKLGAIDKQLAGNHKIDDDNSNPISFLM